MRIIGGITAFMICMLAGWSKASVLRIRESTMRSFASDLETLADEMEYRPRDIRNMAEKLFKGRLGQFWSDFAEGIIDAGSAEESWSLAAKKCSDFGLLDTDELEMIIEAGRSIGQRNMDSSVKTLRHWSKVSARRADELRERINIKGTLYRKLGVLGGLAAMLLIV